MPKDTKTSLENDKTDLENSKEQVQQKETQLKTEKAERDKKISKFFARGNKGCNRRRLVWHR